MIRFFWAIALLLFCPWNAHAMQNAAGADQQVTTVEDSQMPIARFNLPLPTMGGKQFWTDHIIRNGWKIQQNAITQHWRLIDDRSVRRAWGNRAACDRALQQAVEGGSVDSRQENVGATQAPERKQRHIVVLIHGLMRSTDSMEGLSKRLESEEIGEVVLFQYASTRASIGAHAIALRAVVEDIVSQEMAQPEGKSSGAEAESDLRISFCGHSMGNIVVRHAMGDWQRNDPVGVLDRLGKFVMLGPPNQGASIARQLSKTGLFEFVTGQGGMELGPEWEALSTKLAVPPCPFGIVAGRLSESMVSNPLVGAAGDFVVSVDETQLEGATDFIELPVLHSFLMDNEESQAAVIRFFRTKSFQ
jgi:hypothetical protein